MMGERVGGPGDGIREGQIQEVIIKVKRPSWWRRNISKPMENFFNGRSGNATAGTIPTFSQAPSHRVPSTIGSAIQNFRDSNPISGYGTAMGANMIAKTTTDGIIDVANFARNYIVFKSPSAIFA